MRRFVLCIPFLLATVSAVGAPAPFQRRNPIQEDLKKLQGEWQGSSGVSWVICNARVKFIEKGQAVSEWAIALNTSKPQKELEFTWLAGEDKGYRLRGTFFFVEDKLFVYSWWEPPSDGRFPLCGCSPVLKRYDRKKP
jgi:hypothetical protein